MAPGESDSENDDDALSSEAESSPTGSSPSNRGGTTANLRSGSDLGEELRSPGILGTINEDREEN